MKNKNDYRSETERCRSRVESCRSSAESECCDDSRDPCSICVSPTSLLHTAHCTTRTLPTDPSLPHRGHYSGKVRSGQPYLHHRPGVHSSRPSRGSRLRTVYSYCCHTPDQPGSPGVRRELRRQPGRHSRPGRHHRDCQDCSTSCPGNSAHCTSRLEAAPARPLLSPLEPGVAGEV